MLPITLNLLPPAKKEALQKLSMLAYAQSMVLLFAAMAVLIVSFLIPFRLMLTTDFEAISDQSTPAQDEYTAALNEIAAVNGLIARVDGIQQRWTPWSEVLAKLTALIPAKIHLDRIETHPDGTITMSGVAETRNDLLALQAHLSDAPFLMNITSPLSNILQRTEVKFELAMKYKNE